MEISPLLTIRPTPTKGRSAHSTVPLPAGAQVLHCLPYALGVLPSHRKRLCAHLACSRTSPTYFLTKCPACEAAFYCSTTCRARNAQKHAWVCGGLRRLRGWAKDRHVAGVMGLVLEVLAQAKLDSDLVQVEDEDDLLREELYAVIFPEKQGVPLCRPTFSDVLVLQSHLSSWPASELEDWTRHAPFLLSLFSACPPELLPTGWGLTEILDLASKLESNGFGLFAGEENVATGFVSEGGVRLYPEISSQGRGKSGVCFARGVYPQASFFNHSCAPNAQADPMTALELFKAPGLEVALEKEVVPLEHVRTLGLGRPLTFSIVLPEGEVLPAGEEITISYVSVSLPRPNRRAQLASEYHFDCSCERCEDEDRRKTKASKKEKISLKKSKK
ncbi:hypothetical protein CALVIDRAFT_78055 [Calocera viscosa TUFC12733]|uniref:SET domain-containing protein n=1 Tax=Calocera viscosa (strain TUFC12733) TaxID=1330018 RepID=A0A167NFJ2_CALVF|nr:hypothetical protein CALVIDRAFT_78055 [Calocera viscosa TUFC12733]